MAKFLDKNIVLNGEKFTAMTRGADNVLKAALISVAYYGVMDGSVPILKRLEGLKSLMGIKKATEKVCSKLMVVKDREKLSDKQKGLFSQLRAEWSVMSESEVFESIESWFAAKPEPKAAAIKLPQDRMKSLHKYVQDKIDTEGMPQNVVEAITALKLALEGEIV